MSTPPIRSHTEASASIPTMDIVDQAVDTSVSPSASSSAPTPSPNTHQTSSSVQATRGTDDGGVSPVDGVRMTDHTPGTDPNTPVSPSDTARHSSNEPAAQTEHTVPPPSTDSHRPPPPFVPPIFFLPDGTVIFNHLPHPSDFFHAPRTDPTPPGNVPSDTSEAPHNAQPHITLPPPVFHFFGPMPPAEPEPDPEKAAELLRSLPTVGKGLLRRVNKILAADQMEEDRDERGWKCGVCLEGVEDKQEPTEAKVKALPCNHLFHEHCLLPWFTNRHTCPTCRLDLDPLRTLKTSSGGQGSMRPSQTGGQRSPSGHPYARPAEGQSRPATPRGTDFNATFTVVWRMPVPGDSASAGTSQPEISSETTSTSTPPAPAIPSAASGPTESSTSGLPSTPSPPPQMFGSPMHASPIPMERSTTIPATNTNVPAADSSSDNVARPRPERRPHITVVHHHHPPPPASDHLRPPTPHNHHVHPPPPGNQTSVGTVHFFFNHPPPAPRPPAPVPNEKPFIPQSLESWTEERERNLGWRCDAPECQIAPPIEPDADVDVDMIDPNSEDDSSKELLSIYSPTQPPLGEVKEGEKGFVMLACEHRWHRTCLESFEMASGRFELDPDAEGKVWVRCGKCRKDGWINPRGSHTRSTDALEVVPV